MGQQEHLKEVVEDVLLERIDNKTPRMPKGRRADVLVLLNRAAIFPKEGELLVWAIFDCKEELEKVHKLMLPNFQQEELVLIKVFEVVSKSGFEALNDEEMADLFSSSADVGALLDHVFLEDNEIPLGDWFKSLLHELTSTDKQHD